MGRYCSASDLYPSLVSETVVAQITNDDASATTVETAVLATLIGDAEAEVDGYLGYRYALPLSSVPHLVTRLSARITRFRLYTSRPGEAEEWLTSDYDNAVKMLEAIRDGKVSLGLTEAGEDPAAGQSGERAVRSSSQARVFGRTNMGGY